MSNPVKYPRLLVIGNCCLSNITSNGRTLRNFLVGWPKDKLAQFCLRFEYPDFETCENYYCVSDADALNAFLHKKKVNKAESQPAMTAVGSASAKNPRRKDALAMYLRDIVWSSKKWQGKNFKKWIDDFSPELILFQAGDFAYLCNLAVSISKERNIPIVIYNSESYYLKDFDYLRSQGISKLFYPLLRGRFRKSFKKLMKRADSAIYSCDMLTEDYQKSFATPGYTIYTATENKSEAHRSEKELPTVSYLGNLGVGRHQGLVDIANALQAISEKLRIDVYGKIPTSTVKEAFEACAGINYCGFVSYEQVKTVMANSDILVHTENFSNYSRLDLKYAFSTKIADSLASGRCFLLYAPEEIAASQYLIKNESAYVVSDKNELAQTLNMLVNNPASRAKYFQNAMSVVEKNHTADKNSKAFQKILLDAVHKEL